MTDLMELKPASILVLDDEWMALEGMKYMLKTVLPPETQVTYVQFAKDAVAYGSGHRVDIAFLDITLRDGSGVEVAEALMKTNPQVNIIFCTGCGEYAQTALSMHVSGYIMKPASAEKLVQELTHLRYPIAAAAPHAQEPRLLKLLCFGNFDVFTPDGQLLAFSRSKSKELLAYLVYKKGGRVSIRETAATLFEDKPYDDRLQNYLQQIISTLSTTLEEAGAKEVLLRSRGYLAINRDAVECDYFDYLDGRLDAKRNYMGEFLCQYSWAELVNAELEHED